MMTMLDEGRSTRVAPFFVEFKTVKTALHRSPKSVTGINTFSKRRRHATSDVHEGRQSLKLFEHGSFRQAEYALHHACIAIRRVYGTPGANLCVARWLTGMATWCLLVAIDACGLPADSLTLAPGRRHVALHEADRLYFTDSTIQCGVVQADRSNPQF